MGWHAQNEVMGVVYRFVCCPLVTRALSFLHTRFRHSLPHTFATHIAHTHCPYTLPAPGRLTLA